jgi:hypothetical protein
MKYTVVVTWLDAIQEAYTAEEVYVKDGCLVLTMPGFSNRGNTRNIPLKPVRIYTVERV